MWRLLLSTLVVVPAFAIMAGIHIALRANHSFDRLIKRGTVAVNRAHA